MTIHIDAKPLTVRTMRTRAGVLERRCSRCHGWWPLSRFTPATKSGRNSSGYHCTCKPCINLWKKEKRARVADPTSDQGLDLPVVHRVVDARTAPPVRIFPSTWLSPIAETASG